MQLAAASGEAELAAGLTPAEHHHLNTLLSALIPDQTGALPDSITNRTGFLIAHAHHQLRERGGHALRSLASSPATSAHSPPSPRPSRAPNNDSPTGWE